MVLWLLAVSVWVVQLAKPDQGCLNYRPRQTTLQQRLLQGCSGRIALGLELEMEGA